jgi:hypothetical protein
MSECARHKYVSQGYRVVRSARATARTMAKWIVAESSTCSACSAVGTRILKEVRALDGWEAARLAGIPESDLSAVNVTGGEPVTHTAAVEQPLTAWPFPLRGRKLEDIQP